MHVVREVPHWLLVVAAIMALLPPLYTDSHTRFSVWLAAFVVVGVLGVAVARWRRAVQDTSADGDLTPAYPLLVAAAAVWLASEVTFLNHLRLYVSIALGGVALASLFVAAEHAGAQSPPPVLARCLVYGLLAAAVLVPVVDTELDRGLLRSYTTALNRCRVSRGTTSGKGGTQHWVRYRIEVGEHPNGGPGWLEMPDQDVCLYAEKGYSVRITVQPGLLGIPWLSGGAVEVVGRPRPR